MVKKKSGNLQELSKELNLQNSGKEIFRNQLRNILNNRIDHARRNLEVKLTRFLNSNRRVDRDKVLKKKQEILTYKQLLKHDIFQSDI